MKLSTKFLGTGPLPSEGQMCLLKQIFEGGFLTFKNITHNLFSHSKSLLYQMKDCAKERSNFGGKCSSLEKSCFFSFFFRPTISCPYHVFFYLYSKCLLCLSGRSEDTWVINSSYPLSSLDLSTFIFLSF